MSTQTEKAYIKTSHGKGNGLFSRENISLGSLIVSIAKPLVAIPSNETIVETCAACMLWQPEATTATTTAATYAFYSASTQRPLLQCTGCRVLKYCDKSCQRNDWKCAHKAECAIFAKLAPRVLPASVRATVRLLLLYPDVIPANVLQLCNHIDAFRSSSSSDNWATIALMARGAHEYSRTAHSYVTVLELYCRVLVNTLTYTTPTLDPIGLCIDPVAALVNHSCAPNAVVLFSPHEGLQIRSVAPIAQDEEITLAYVDTTYPHATRQKELLQRWFFECCCTLCSSTEHIDNANIAIPAPSLTQPLPSALAALKSHYSRPQSKPYHQPLAALHSTIAKHLLSSKSYVEALRHEITIYNQIDNVLYPQLHPITIRDNFVIAVLMLEVGSGHAFNINDHDWILATRGVWTDISNGVLKSHGQQSAFAKIVRKMAAEVLTSHIENDIHNLTEIKTKSVLEQISKDLLRELGCVLI